jgi:6-phosphogluconolactonase (cycloisomerase 2 family)
VGLPVATGASPYAIAGSPDKQHVYVVNQGTNNISAYAVNTTSGALTQIAGSPFAAGTDPQALVFDPSGVYLYVANASSNDLSAYMVDAGTGVLTPLPTATYGTGTGPSAVAIDRAGKFIFVANNGGFGGSNTISVFTISPGTGELTPVPGSPFAASCCSDLSPRSLVFVDSGGLYGLYVSAFEMFLGSVVTSFSVDHITGALTLLSSFGVTVDNYIATDRNGVHLYVTTGGGIVGYAVADAGDLFNLSGFPIATGANAYSVTVDPSNQFLYVANDGAATVSGYKRNGDALQAITGSPFAAGHNPDFIAIL